MALKRGICKMALKSMHPNSQRRPDLPSLDGGVAPGVQRGSTVGADWLEKKTSAPGQTRAHLCSAEIE